MRRARGLAVDQPVAAVMVEDVTGDGAADIVALVVGARESPAGTLVLSGGLPGGAFGTPERFEVFDFPSGMVAGDYDGDGRVDVVVSYAPGEEGVG